MVNKKDWKIADIDPEWVQDDLINDSYVGRVASLSFRYVACPRKSDSDTGPHWFGQQNGNPSCDACMTIANWRKSNNLDNRGQSSHIMPRHIRIQYWHYVIENDEVPTHLAVARRKQPHVFLKYQGR